VIELERHIEILLLSNDCVIVPDLGGFMAHHVDASYSKDDATFLPPLRTLGFNPQLKMNDSLLVQSYIEAYDISYPEALRRLEAEVCELRQHLETEGEYDLNDIGVLRLNDEGHLEFEPCEAGILTPSLYGLSSFEMHTLSNDEAPAEEETDDTLDSEDMPEEHITIKMKWLRNVAAVAAAVVAFLMIGTPVSNSRFSTTMQQSAFLSVNTHHEADSTTDGSEVETAAEGNDSQADALTATADTEMLIEEMPAAEPETETAEAPATEGAMPMQQQPTAKYTIVLASQVSEKGANNFISILQREGFAEAAVDVNQNRVRRVVYGNYATETEAQNAIRSLRAESKHFREAWVMKR